MRTITSAFFGIVIFVPFVVGEEQRAEFIEVTLPISEVLVAPGNAVVSRIGDVVLPQGDCRVRVVGLPAAMDRESVQVDLPDAANVQLESVKLELVATRKLEPEQIQAVEKELAELERQIKGLEDQHQLLGAELLVIQTFSPNLKPLQDASKVSSEALIQGSVLDPNTWLSVIRFAGNLAEKKRQIIAETTARKSDLELKRNESAARLEELRRTSVPARVVADIALRTEKAGIARLTVRYIVDHVAWYPAYELHADEEGRKISIERQALVGQNSGEDWPGAALTFTTLPPEKAVYIPDLTAWKIAYSDVHGSVESQMFGQQRPDEEAIAPLSTIPGPEAILALREAYLGKRASDVTTAFDYEDQLVQLSLELGKLGMGGVELGAGAFEQRSGGGRSMMIKRHGGNKYTESSIDTALTFLAGEQRSDGSWNDTGSENNTVGITGITILSFLGAGHTSKVGQFKENVQKGLAWLCSRVQANGQIGYSLFDQSQATTALAEGYGMSNLPSLVDPALRAVRHLNQMLRNRLLPIIPGLTDNRFPNGIENLAFAAMAAKSCRVAGLPVPPSFIENLLILSQQLERTKSTPRANAVVALTRQLLGHPKEEIERFIPLLMTELPNWIPGRFHLGYLQIGSLVCFHQGGDVWLRWNEAQKKTLLENMKDGSWASEDSWIGPIKSRVATTAFCAASLEIYYRYMQLDGRRGSGSSQAQMKPTWTPVSPQVSSNGRLYRFRADGLRTVVGDGYFHRIPIDHKTVESQSLHVATPVVYKGVYLQSTMTNPFEEPLLEGSARVFQGHEFMGETALPHVDPGKELIAPLGEDPYVTIDRKVTEETTRSGKLTKLYTLRAGIQISLENKRQTPIRVRVTDRVAVSSDTRVRVRNGVLKGGREQKLQEDGVASWDIDLKAGQKDALEATYEVEFPDGVTPQPAMAP